MNNSNAYTIWLTGLSGSGKTTIAKSLERKFRNRNIPLVMLDEDHVGCTLSNDLGFSKYCQDKNVIRIANVAYLVTASRVFAIVCVVSPTRRIRRFARQLIKNFVEIYIECPLSICETRDVKGHYQRVRNGKITGFVGITISYEKPIYPEITVNTDKETLARSVDKIMKYLEKEDII